MENNSPSYELYKNKKQKDILQENATVRKLKLSRFPRCEFKNITGHSSEHVLNAYDSGNEDKMFAISSAICNQTVVPSK